MYLKNVFSILTRQQTLARSLTVWHYMEILQERDLHRPA